MFGVGASAQETGFNPFRLLRRVVVLLFTLIQGVLIARIFIDLGVIPTENTFSDVVVFWSNFLAAPVQGIGSGLGALFGGGGIEMIAGEGLDVVIVTALVGWTVVENLAMRFFSKLETV